jgi:hypothetical protein
VSYHNTSLHPEDGDNTILLNVGNLLKHSTASKPRRPRREHMLKLRSTSTSGSETTEE